MGCALLHATGVKTNHNGHRNTERRT